MLEEEIDDSEYLYRRVILNPSFWDSEKKLPTSAIFKDSNGVSVDRQGERSQKDIIRDALKYPLKALVHVKTEKCRELDTVPVYKPVEDNMYHSEIHDSIDKVRLSSSKAKRLRDNCKVVYINSIE
jgi:hypothetical protein